MSATVKILSTISVLIIPFLLASCTEKRAETPVMSKPAASDKLLRVCTGTTYSVLFTIAEQKGLFAKEGVRVELKPYAIGRDALEAMLSGSCDLATSADTPIADYGIKRDDVRVIAGIAKSDNLNCIIATRKSGIRKVSDMKGHRIGVTKGTAPHFFLDLELNKNGLGERDLNLQFMKGEALHQALEQGDFDAIATTDMNAYRLLEKLGEKIVLISDPGIALNHGYIAVLNSTVQTRREDLLRMLAALKSAEKIAAENPVEAKKLFRDFLGVSPGVADRLWENITPRLSLESAMVLTLEDNARWLRERADLKGAQKSFKTIMAPELLREIAPERVSY